MLKNIICLTVTCITIQQIYTNNGIPHPNQLRIIYSIEQASNISIDYKQVFDDKKEEWLGKVPNYVNKEQLRLFDVYCNWDDPETVYDFSVQKCYVATIKDAFVQTNDLGVTFDHIQEFRFKLHRFIKGNYPLIRPLSRNVHKMPVKHVTKLATVQGPTFFYHWLIDRMPSIYLLRDLINSDPDIKLTINTHSPRQYIFDYLELLNIPKEKVLIPKKNLVYHADTVYFGTPFLMEPIPQKLLNAMANELICAAKQKVNFPEKTKKKILIIQRTETNRRFRNLQSLVECAKKIFNTNEYDIVVYSAQNSVANQIAEFHTADVIIGAMASGLSNVIYAQHGTHVIEIRPPIEVPQQSKGESLRAFGVHWCWWLCCARELEYWPVVTPFKFDELYLDVPIDEIETVLREIAQQIQ